MAVRWQKLHPRKRLLQTEDYGMDEIRANALYKLTSDYSVSVLQEWREEGGSICHLLEVTAGNTEYANGLLRMNVIDESYYTLFQPSTETERIFSSQHYL